MGIKPHTFNTTNLHFHGLHVNPYGYPGDPDNPKENENYMVGDNVLMAIPPGGDAPPGMPQVRPGSERRFKIQIPTDHPPGTFWYHAHPHGSTAIQVGSGMSGALIVEDNMEELDKIAPDLAAVSQPDREKIMVFQSILYDGDGKAEQFAPFSGPDWQKSKRRITINGQVMPKITMKVGEIQRWRMVGSTFREMLNLQLPKATFKNGRYELDPTEGLDLHEIALDGLYLPRVDTWKRNANTCNRNQPEQPSEEPDTAPVELHAGYRSDVLVQATEPGTYILVDCPIPAGRNGSMAISSSSSPGTSPDTVHQTA